MRSAEEPHAPPALRGRRVEPPSFFYSTMRRGESAKERCYRRSRELDAQALSALHQIPQQIRRHRQLGERQATGSDLLDRTADARSFWVGREPVLGGLLAGLAGCKHIGDQSSFGGCDLVNGAVDGETFEKIVRRHAACGGD